MPEASEDETTSRETPELDIDQSTILYSPDQQDQAEEARNAEPDTQVVGEAASRQFGDYRILGEIARGGMGVVYRAKQSGLNRIVALKTIRGPEFAGPEEIERFRAEAEAVARLEHPGIVQVFDVGVVQGQHYFSMAYVEGTTLSGLMKDGPLDSLHAASLLAKISGAVSYAHERNVIHRDLKPGNILIDAGGEPRVTDFGLAKRTDSDSELTGTGQILGTPSYMSPEQAAGRTEQVGPASDIYSLGSILYCLMTGRPPFQSPRVMDTLQAVMHQEPVPPSRFNPTVDADLQTICLKCLRKDPFRRYATASNLADDLNRFIRGEPIVARPVSRRERLWKWARRNPTVALLSAVVATVTLAMLIGGAIYQVRLRRALENADTERENAEISEDARTELLYESLTDQAAFLSETRPVGYGQKVWNAIRQSTQLETRGRDDTHLRQLAVNALGHASFQTPVPLSGIASPVTAADVTPDDRFVVVGLESGEIVIFDAETLTEQHRFREHSDAILAIRFPEPGFCLTSTPFCRQLNRWGYGPDGWQHDNTLPVSAVDNVIDIRLSRCGRFIVGWTGGQAPPGASIDAWTEQPRFVLSESDMATRYLCLRPVADTSGGVHVTPLRATQDFHVSAHGVTAGYEKSDGSVWHYDLHTGATSNPVTHGGDSRSIAVDSTGQYVAVGGHSGVRIHAIDGSRPPRQLLNRHGSVIQFRSAETLSVVDREDQLVMSAARQMTDFVNPDYDDARRFFFSSSGRHRFDIVLYTPNIAVCRSSSDECSFWNGSASDLVFSPDGRFLLCGSDSKATTIRDVATGETVASLNGIRGDFHPDGRLLVITDQKEIRLLTLPDLQTVASAECRGHLNRLRFSADGSHVVCVGWDPGEFRVFRVENASSTSLEDCSISQVLNDANAYKSAAWAPEGNRLAWTSRDPGTRVWRLRMLDFDRPEETASVFASNIMPAFSSMTFPDRKRVSALSFGRVEIWNPESLVRERRGDEVLKHPMCLSGDRSMMLARHKLVDVASLKSSIELPTFLGDPWGMDWSRDNRHVAFSYVDGSIAVWNLEAVSRRLAELKLNIPDLQFMTVEPLTELQRLKQRSVERYYAALPLPEINTSQDVLVELASQQSRMDDDGGWRPCMQKQRLTPESDVTELTDWLVWLCRHVPNTTVRRYERDVIKQSRFLCFKSQLVVTPETYEAFATQLLDKLSSVSAPTAGTRIMHAMALAYYGWWRYGIDRQSGTYEQTELVCRKAIAELQQLMAEGLISVNDFGELWFGVHRTHGLTLRKLGRSQEAIEVLTQSVDFHQSTPDSARVGFAKSAYERLSELLEKVGQTDKASQVTELLKGLTAQNENL